MSVHRLLQGASRVGSLAVNLSRVSPIGARSTIALQKQPIAFISTSKKNRDTTITTDQPTTASIPKTVEDFANPDPKKNYQSFGFIEDDPDWDINIRNYVMFWTVTVFFCGAGFFMCYFPDVRIRDWTQREAYIELARREALGLPIIDPDLVPLDKMVLPTDEELGDYDIII